MRFNILILALATLLTIQAKQDYDYKLGRQLTTVKRYTKTYYKKTYTKKYVPSKTSYTGQFYGGRSHAVLYVYYLPPNYYNPIGYYSSLYGKTYYNGYGYNFYYGKYGYYQNSPNEVYVSSSGSPLVGIIMLLCCCGCFCALIFLCRKCNGSND